LQVTLQHHFASNAHAYRLLIIKEHRNLQSFNSSSCVADYVYRYQHRSEILICFLLRRQVFLKISFLNTLLIFISSRLGFLCRFQSIRFRVLLSTAKRRDFDLLSQRRQALFENSF